MNCVATYRGRRVHVELSVAQINGLTPDPDEPIEATEDLGGDLRVFSVPLFELESICLEGEEED